MPANLPNRRRSNLQRTALEATTAAFLSDTSPKNSTSTNRARSKAASGSRQATSLVVPPLSSVQSSTKASRATRRPSQRTRRGQVSPSRRSPELPTRSSTGMGTEGGIRIVAGGQSLKLHARNRNEAWRATKFGWQADSKNWLMPAGELAKRVAPMEPQVWNHYVWRF